MNPIVSFFCRKWSTSTLDKRIQGVILDRLFKKKEKRFQEIGVNLYYKIETESACNISTT